MAPLPPSDLPQNSDDLLIALFEADLEHDGGEAAQAHWQAGRPIHYVDEATPEGHVIREYPALRRCHSCGEGPLTDATPQIRNIIDAALHRPTVIGGRIHIAAIESLQGWVGALPSDRWCDGDGSIHSWDEYRFTGDELDWLIGKLPPILAIAAMNTAVWTTASGAQNTH